MSSHATKKSDKKSARPVTKAKTSKEPSPEEFTALLDAARAGKTIPLMRRYPLRQLLRLSLKRAVELAQLQTTTARVPAKELASFLHVHPELLDEEGKIVPTDAAVLHVEREFSDRPPAEKWRLAQAETLTYAFRKANLATFRDLLRLVEAAAAFQK